MFQKWKNEQLKTKSRCVLCFKSGKHGKNTINKSPICYGFAEMIPKNVLN